LPRRERSCDYLVGSGEQRGRDREAYAARHYTPELRSRYVEALRRIGLPEK